MSKEAAKAYIERLKSDEEFRQRVAGCKNMEERFAVAKQEGYEFTSEEIKQLNDELNSEELAGVSGGSICEPWCAKSAEPPCCVDHPEHNKWIAG